MGRYCCWDAAGAGAGIGADAGEGIGADAGAAIGADAGADGRAGATMVG